MLELISPHAAALATDSGQAYASIAIDSNLTAKSLLKGATYFSLLVLLLNLFDSRQKLRWLAYTILTAGMIQAAYGSYMVLSGIEYTFFTEKVPSYRGSATGTFVNRNHFAGYLEMVLAIGIGLMISTLAAHRSHNWRERIRKLFDTLLSSKALIRVTLIVICIGLILSKSRMGNAAFFASLFASGVFFLIVSRHSTRSTTLFLVSLIVLDMLLVGSWVGVERVIERIEITSISAEKRDEVARDTLTMISEQPMAGVGGGNYFSVFPNYQQKDIWDNYYHAHNDYLEFLAEYGITGVLLLAMAVCYCLFLTMRTMRQRKDPLMLGLASAAFMGMISILIHSPVDFNLQIPANAGMFIMLMGLAIIAASLPSHHKHSG